MPTSTSRGLICAILFAFLLRPAPVAEARPVPPIPPSLYPAGAQVRFAPDVTNDRMDALWDFDGNRDPLMHEYPQSQFQRQGGWMERATLRRGNNIAWFVLFDSTYGTLLDGRQGNTFAYADEQLMLRDWWHAPLTPSQPGHVLPPGSTGGAEARLIPRSMDGPAVTLSLWWGTSHEIEAIAYYTPHFLGQKAAERALAAQVRYAVRLAVTAPDRSTR